MAIAIIVIVVVVLIATAGVYIVYSSGSPKTQKMNFSDFTAVDVGSAFKVSITQSNTYSVIITANEEYSAERSYPDGKHIKNRYTARYLLWHL